MKTKRVKIAYEVWLNPDYRIGGREYARFERGFEVPVLRGYNTLAREVASRLKKWNDRPVTVWIFDADPPHTLLSAYATPDHRRAGTRKTVHPGPRHREGGSSTAT